MVDKVHVVLYLQFNNGKQFCAMIVYGWSWGDLTNNAIRFL